LSSLRALALAFPLPSQEAPAWSLLQQALPFSTGAAVAAVSPFEAADWQPAAEPLEQQAFAGFESTEVGTVLAC
jgi:hypothetical protein